MSLSAEFAVLGQSISLNLGSYLSPALVLNNLHLTIPKGCIYGLIGPSGCGKTTLQKCIMGVHKPDHGIISVFGMTPGSPGSTVPGSSVGYMPQEIALDAELTVREQLIFLGRINSLTQEVINERIEEITSTLEIRDLAKRSGQFSGGQKRRISLACTLIHKPSLYLLDEPTVGSDIVLIRKIWNYLIHLRDTTGATIIISTHYIEEVHSADLFGFMSKGSMIIQDSPKNFIATAGTRSLEEAILKEYIRVYSQNSNRHGKPSFFPEEYLRDINTQVDQRSLIDRAVKRLRFGRQNKRPEQEAASSPDKLPFFRIMGFLIWRYLLRWRICMTPPFIFLVASVSGCSLLMFNAYGLPMKQLALGIVNYGGHSNYLTEMTNFLANEEFRFIYMADETEARNAIENGTTAGYFLVPAHWDEYLKQRVVSVFSPHSSESVVRLSQIKLHQDTSHAGKVESIRLRVYQAMDSLMKNITIQSGLPPDHISFFKSYPVFESLDSADALAPKYIFVVRLYVFFAETFTILLLTAWFLKESRETVNERLISLGMKRYQLLAALMVVAVVFLTASFLFMLSLYVVILNLPQPSSWPAVVLLTMSIIVCGICKACLLGSNIKSEMGCTILIIFYNGLLWLLGCVAWPYEGLDYFMQPLTIMVSHLELSTSLIRMTVYGDSVFAPQVYHGLGVGVVWAVIHLLVTFSLARKW